MPTLGGLMVSLFAGLAGFLGKYLAVRSAAMTAALATFALLITGIYATLSLLAVGVVATFPSIIMTGVWLFVPDNVVGCVTIIAATDTACALYRWNMEALRLAAFTN